MGVGVEHVADAQSLLCRRSQIAIHLGQIGIYQNCGAGLITTEEIGLATAAGNLFENHAGPPNRSTVWLSARSSVSKRGAKFPIVLQHPFPPHGGFSGTVLFCIDEPPGPSAGGLGAF